MECNKSVLVKIGQLLKVLGAVDGVSLVNYLPYFIEYSAHFFNIENDSEIFPVHYTYKAAEKGFKMAFIINKLAMINSCEIIVEK
jgi:hypothetical protein